MGSFCSSIKRGFIKELFLDLIMSPVPRGTPNKFNVSEANQQAQNTTSIRLACCVALLYFFCIVCIKEDGFYLEKSRCSRDWCLFCFSLVVLNDVLNVIQCVSLRILIG